MATSTTTPKGKYTESQTFSTPNCIYADQVSQAYTLLVLMLTGKQMAGIDVLLQEAIMDKCMACMSQDL